jgi:hypothetical protein
MRASKMFLTVFTAVILFCPQISFAVMSNEDMLKKLNELSITIQKQQREIEILRQELKNQENRIDKVQETQHEEVKKEVKAATEEKSKEWSAKIPKWIKNTKVSGDLRLRYEGRYNMEEKQADGSKKNLPTRDRYRIRARLFFDSKITDEIGTHLMICTNQDEHREATTTNQTFSDDFSDKGIYLHRAYAVYKPNWLNGLELTAGKFKNTFLNTRNMWDPDVNPEGVYERYQYQGWKNFKPFIHLGQMVVNEVKDQTDDAALYINQLGFDWNLRKVKWTLAGSYTDWANIHNSKYLHEAEYKGGGGNTFTRDSNGDLQYAYDYNLWEGITSIKFKLWDIPTTLTFDYIVNTADHVPSDHDTAYYAGFQLGDTKKKGDWFLRYYYAWIENDAVIGSMNDQDFYGANRKGHKIRARYMLYDQVHFTTTYLHTDNLNSWDASSDDFSKQKSREQEDRLQCDFGFTF